MTGYEVAVWAALAAFGYAAVAGAFARASGALEWIRGVTCPPPEAYIRTLATVCAIAGAWGAAVWAFTSGLPATGPESAGRGAAIAGACVGGLWGAWAWLEDRLSPWAWPVTVLTTVTVTAAAAVWVAGAAAVRATWAALGPVYRITAGQKRGDEQGG